MGAAQCGVGLEPDQMKDSPQTNQLRLLRGDEWLCS